MTGLVFDLGASLRYLRQRPLLAVLAIGTLGIGLGVASALFAVIDALYVRPLPLDPRKEIVVVRATHDREVTSVSRADMNDLLGNLHVAAYGGMRDWSFALLANGTREPVGATLATAALFHVFRIQPHLGRVFRDDDSRAILVTYSAWKKRFAGDPQIVGRTLTLGDDVFTVIGVLAEHFVAPSFRDAELWAPLSYDPDYARGRELRNLIVYARLASPHELDGFRSELLFRARSLEQQHPNTNRGWSARVIPLVEYELGGVIRQLVLLGFAAALLLAMAIANLATLMLSESMSRRSEYGVRAAIGGSTFRLFRQLFLDNLLLCLIGGAAATVLAFVLLSVTKPLVASGIPRFDEVGPNARVLIFALAIAIGTAALFAVTSVWWSGRGEPAEHIRASSRSLEGAARWGSAWLVAVQVAFAFVLLALALHFGWSYFVRATADAGFDPNSLLLVRVKATTGMNREELVQGAGDAAATLSTIPGAVSVSVASSGPMFGAGEELEVATDAVSPHSMLRFSNVDHRFLSTMRIPLVAGRTFTEHDRGRPPVILISRELATRLFPLGGAVGKQLWLGAPRRYAHEIIGVAADAHDARAGRGAVEVYLPFAQDPRAMFFLVARGTFPAQLPPLPRFMVLSKKTMRAAFDEDLLVPKLRMALLALFALGAALLATVAVYGIVTLVAHTRRSEIGLRLALGATPRDVELLLLRAILTPVAIGLAIGWLLLDLAGERVRPLLESQAMSAWPGAITAAFVLTLAIAVSLRSVRETARVVV